MERDLAATVEAGPFCSHGLYGDRVFHGFETEFLKRPLEQRLVVQLLRPRNWVRLASLYFNRSQLAAEYYDEHLFNGHEAAGAGRTIASSPPRHRSSCADR